MKPLPVTTTLVTVTLALAPLDSTKPCVPVAPMATDPKLTTAPVVSGARLPESESVADDTAVPCRTMLMLFTASTALKDPAIEGLKLTSNSASEARPT